MRIKIKARLHPSEDPDKVAEAINNLFPLVDLKVTDKFLTGESTDLASLRDFKNKLGLQAIRDTARGMLKKGRKENLVRFSLNKQAATVGKISFSDDDTPLGPIEVSIEAEEVGELIDHIAPGKEERGN